MGSLCPRCVKNELNNYMTLTLNSDAKFEEEPTCRCKNDMRNRVRFNFSKIIREFFIMKITLKLVLNVPNHVLDEPMSVEPMALLTMETKTPVSDI